MPNVILLENGTSGVLLEDGTGFIMEESGAVAADTTVPTVTITQPAAGATLAGANNPFTATATDNVAVRGIKFYLDNVLIGTEDTTSPYTVNIDATTLSAGTHTLKAVSFDTAGNPSAEATRSVTVAAPAPINYALASNGGVATASRLYTGPEVYPASAVNNDFRACRNDSDAWIVSYAKPPYTPYGQAYMDIALAVPRTITAFGVATFPINNYFSNEPVANETLCTGTFHLTGYTIQYKNSLGVWTDTEVAVTGNNFAYRKVTLAAPITATEFRLLITDSADVSLSESGRLLEFEVWGT